MEERFREDISRYVRRSGTPPITPSQIPALISASGGLPPTARNKRFNAVLASKNFGGQRSMLTLIPAKSAAMDKNLVAMTKLVVSSRSLGSMSLGGTAGDGKKLRMKAALLETKNDQIVAFLEDYRWLESDYTYPQRPADTSLQIDFLNEAAHGIVSWLIVAPQRRESFGDSLVLNGTGKFTVKERHRDEGRGFQVFGEPPHRTIAEFLAGIEPGKSRVASPDENTKRLRIDHRGVMLLYPVRETKEDKVSIGFELFFPPNKIPFDVNFTVRRKSEQPIVVVEELS